MVMRFICAVALLLSVSSVAGADTEQRKFPLALNPDFQFRKAKIYSLSPDPSRQPRKEREHSRESDEEGQFQSECRGSGSLDKF